MGKLTAVVVLAVLVTAGLPAHAAVTLTFSPSSVTAAQVNAGVSINIVLTGSTSTCSQVSFHLAYDKTKVAVSNEAVVTGLSLLTPTSDTDGEHFGGFTSGTPITLTNPTTVGSFTLTTVAGQDPTGVNVTFNTTDLSGNATAVLNGNSDPITIDTLGSLAITAGPPNPAHSPVLAITPLPPTKLKDSVTPFNVSVTWTTGVGKAIQIQYNTGAGFPTNGATQGTITDLSAPGTSPLTCHWASGLTVDQAISVRCRILDQGDVWNGTAAVDAAANPTVGWTAGTTVNVDNVAPTLTSASGTDGSADVIVTFNEAVTDATALVKANYTVKQDATVLTIDTAVAAGTGKVKLTLLSAHLDIANAGHYTVAADGIADPAGNVSGALGPVTLTFKPVLQSASLVQNAAKNQVDAVFSNAMTAGTVQTASAWSVTGGTGTRTVTAAVLQGDGKTVRLTLSAALAMNVTYTVTCPTTAADASTAVTVGADNHVDFTTPFWHDFAAGFFTVGIPLADVDGRVLSLLGATKVASFDPTANTGAGGYVVDPGTLIDQTHGMGYFARFSAATTSFLSGATITTGNTTLPAVQAGWNLVTDPYLTSAGVDVPIQINWITSGANALQYAWYWDGTQYQLIANLGAPASGVHVTASPIMHAWTGYFINQPTTGDIVIHQVAPAGVDVKPLQVGDKSSVLIQLVARAGNSVDSTNVCGVAASAVKIANPPYAAGSVDLAFIDEDGNPQAFDVTTGSVARKFNLLVTTDQANADVTVSAPDLSAVPKEYTVILSDPETGKKCALRTSAGFTFTAGAAGASKRLVLEIAPRSTAALVTGVSVAQAGAGHVVVTYQLSGAAAVSASVMNIAGRVVRTLVASSTETAGTHTLAWDLANGAGAAVPRGTYLLRLQARTEDGQQIESVRTFAVNR